MPYDDSNRPKSWKLLAMHAARPDDSWVEFAHRERIAAPVEAILCVAERELHETEFDPSFHCELHQGDVLLFLRTECPTGLPFSLEMKIQGESGQQSDWRLVLNGRGVPDVIHEVLPPQVSETFRHGNQGYEPLRFRAVSASRTSHEILQVSARMVVHPVDATAPASGVLLAPGDDNGLWASVSCELNS